jgi:hypothetical protein
MTQARVFEYTFFASASRAFFAIFFARGDGLRLATASACLRFDLFTMLAASCSFCCVMTRDA